jgi:hypothetical protein
MPHRYATARIGLDLDNTLISYDRLFYEAALERGLIGQGSAGTKRSVRDRVRLLPGGELEWQRLQAYVYGPAIGRAEVAGGALEFIRVARASGAELSIISHKTTLANTGSGDVNLRDAARAWLQQSRMLGADAVPEGHLFFESTRAEKIERIVTLGCTHFIDDLEEVFDDPSFPSDVAQILLASGSAVPAGKYDTYSSFHEIVNAFIAD